MTLFGEPAKIIPRIFQHFYLRAIFTADWWWNTLKWLGYRVHLFYYILTLGILKRPLGRLACKTVKNQPTMHGIHNKLLKLILKPQMRPFFVWKEIYFTISIMKPHQSKGVNEPQGSGQKKYQIQTETISQLLTSFSISVVELEASILVDWLARWLKVCGNQKMSAKLFAATAKLFLYKCHNFLFVVVHAEFPLHLR